MNYEKVARWICWYKVAAQVKKMRKIYVFQNNMLKYIKKDLHEKIFYEFYGTNISPLPSSVSLWVHETTHTMQLLLDTFKALLYSRLHMNTYRVSKNIGSTSKVVNWKKLSSFFKGIVHQFCIPNVFSVSTKETFFKKVLSRWNNSDSK